MNSLDRYLQEHGDQEVVEERELQVEKNPRLEKLLEVYEGWLGASSNLYGEDSYTYALGAVVGLEYTATDVCDLSLRLGGYEEHKSFLWSGLFLSALVNTGDDESYEVVTEHLDTKLIGLGYRNVKELTVIGDVGAWAGERMSGGELCVEGKIASISSTWHGGDIYERGKLVRGGKR